MMPSCAKAVEAARPKATTLARIDFMSFLSRERQGEEYKSKNGIRGKK
jgi:hypothetical protein